MIVVYEFPLESDAEMVVCLAEIPESTTALLAAEIRCQAETQAHEKEQQI